MFRARVVAGFVLFFVASGPAQEHQDRNREKLDARTSSTKTFREREYLALASAGSRDPAAWSQGMNPPSSNPDSERNSRRSKSGLSAADGDGSIVQEIKTLHEQHRRAMLEGDAGLVEKYLTADYLGSGSDGRLVTKDQEVQMLKSGAIKYEAINERDINVRVYGDTAILSVLASVSASMNGKSTKGDYRETFVWVKQEGNWKLASFQATRVAPITPRPGNNLGHDARPITP